MKIIPICIALFAVLCVCIFINAEFINNCSTFLEESAERLADVGSREKVLSELEGFWYKSRDLMGISISDDELDKTESIIARLRCAYGQDNLYEFDKYRAELKSAAASLSRKERFSLGNLF